MIHAGLRVTPAVVLVGLGLIGGTPEPVLELMVVAIARETTIDCKLGCGWRQSEPDTAILFVGLSRIPRTPPAPRSASRAAPPPRGSSFRVGGAITQ